MASVKPFRAVRPRPDLADQVASLPYDVMNREEAAEMAKGKPYNFLHIGRSEIDLPEEKDQYAPDVYKKARENFERFMAEGILRQDETPHFYLYQQTMGERVQTGLVATVSVDEYLNGEIKRHELTRKVKEIDRINHFDIVDAHTEPVFLTYRGHAGIAEQTTSYQAEHEPDCSFVTDDGIRHTVWTIRDEALTRHIEASFREVPTLYIADGHHRSASSAHVGVKRRKEYPDAPADAAFNRFMAVIFPDTDLKIYDYNRFVSDLNGLSEDQFLVAVNKSFDVTRLTGNEPFRPKVKGEIGMYLNHAWYKLTAHDYLSVGKGLSDRLDVSLLQDHVLAPFLGIDDPRTNERIDFVGGIRGLDALATRVDEEGGVAFSMYPPTLDDLMCIADDGLIMPPKSTWFEPKLRSGLFVHRLSD
jgi:uncharacterized protein (DUF1015 family)